MDRQQLRGKIQTVTGLIEPDELGATLMHEHVFCDLRTPALAAERDQGPPITLENLHDVSYGRQKHAGKYVLEGMDLATSELAALRRAGGRSLVELTCGGIKPDPAGLGAVAAATGVQIVMGCGYYVEEYQAPAVFEKSVDEFAREMIASVFEGAWGTDVRAGVIGEIGCQHPWTALERRVMRGALVAQAETGALLNVHPGRHPDQPREVADFIKAAGGDLGRTVISHIDRTIFDDDRLLRLASTGVVLEFDLFGTETAYYPLDAIDMPNDGLRLRHLRTLIEHGHLGQIVISHDICYLTRLTRFGGHGYAHIFKNVLPLMRERGFSEAEIAAIMVETPKRLLTVG
jgi:phosphotriesterase-related protein